MRILVLVHQKKVWTTRASQVEEWNVTFVLRDALRRLGHDVTFLPPNQVDRAEKYDLVLMILPYFFALDKTMSPLSLLIAMDAEVRGANVLLYADDWQISRFMDDTRRLQRDVEKACGVFKTFNKAGADEMLERAREVESCLARWLDLGCPKTLLPMYNWGRHDIFTRGTAITRFQTFDPTPFKLTANWPFVENSRNRRWLFDSLSKTDGFEKFEGAGKWPTDHFGDRSGKRGLGEVPLGDICQLYADRWGAVSFKHPHSGSGWFRGRYFFAAHTRTPLLCDPIDAASIGPAYQVSREEIENMGDDDLANIAERQRETFFGLASSMRQSLDVISSFVETRQ